MIKFNDRFEFERDRNAWQLHEWIEGINPKTKEKTKSRKTTYHATLELVLKSIFDKSGSTAKDLDDLVKILKEIKLSIEKVGQQYQCFLDLVGEK